MSQNQWASFSGQQLVAAFVQEADAFGAIAMSPGFETFLSYFSDYDTYLGRLLKGATHQKTIDAALGKSGIIDTATPSKELAQLFCQAQIAACAELFNGWKINNSHLNRDVIRSLVQQGSSSFAPIPAISSDVRPDQYNDSQRLLLNGINVIQNIDTIRVLQVLKLFGFLTTAASETQQLSLGVGNGYRDLFGIHMLPKIGTSQTTTGNQYHFEMIERQAAHTVLVDNDPVYKTHFSELTKNEKSRVLALNADADDALVKIENEQSDSLLELRNLVVCLRIDHRMIPDAEKFLNSIAKVIDASADLVMTIGAGNNLEEFEGRLSTFDALFDSLAEKGLKPVRILLHGRGTAAEMRANPNFGQLAYASYQVLYCKLEKSKLL